MLEARCPSKLHGHLEGHTIEVSCDSRFCGKRPGIAVIHTFDTRTGELLNTKIYKAAIRTRKDGNGTR